MKLKNLGLATCLSAGIAIVAFAQDEGPSAAGSPGWYIGGSFPDPGGTAVVGSGGKILDPGGLAGERLTACMSDIGKYCTAKTGNDARVCLTQISDKISGVCKSALAAIPVKVENTGGVEPCSHSPVCGNRSGGGRQALRRVEWKQTLGYTFAYPFDLPPHGGGVAVAVDSKGNLWALQRGPIGRAQLYEFGPDHKLIRTVGEDALGGHQVKAHGIAIDSEDNVWICDLNASTVKKISPDGKLLMSIGVRGPLGHEGNQRGDWDEAKGQRLLWQPASVAIAKNGDIYIGEGHANESPNDTDYSPTNKIGAARVIHLDKNGKFINQWYGNSTGPGKFSQVHGIAVDPQNGDVWIADREEYRLVVYTDDGHFVKSISMRNLPCAVYFDPHGQLWMASGQDGQILKLDRSGKVLGAIGGGMGLELGQFIETNYMGMDPQGNLYTGDTSVARITKMVAPK